MLPTQELFRSIPCPYYCSGLCERPHCFFRHTKSDVVLARKTEVFYIDDDNLSEEEKEDSKVTKSPLKRPNLNNNSIPLRKEPYENIIIQKDSLSSFIKSKNHTVERRDGKRKISDELDPGCGSSKKVKLNSESEKKLLKDRQERTNEKKIDIDKDQNFENIVKNQNETPILIDIGSDESNIEGTKADNINIGNEKSESSAIKELIINDDEKWHKSDSNKSKHSPTSHSSRNKKEDKNGSYSRSSNSSSSSTSTSNRHHKSNREDEKSHKKSNDKSSSSKSSSSSKERSHKSSSSSSTKITQKSSTDEKIKTKEEAKKQRSDSDSSSKSSIKCKVETNERSKYKSEEIHEDDSTCMLNFSSEFQLPEIFDYEDDPDDIEMQCLRMFEEYKPAENNKNNDLITNEDFSKKFNVSKEESNTHSIGKRRTAHAGADVRVPPMLPIPSARKTTQDLITTVSRRYQSQKPTDSEPSQPSISTLSTMNKPSPSGSAPSLVNVGNSNKKRIAHVTNVTGYLRPATSTGVRAPGINDGHNRSSKNLPVNGKTFTNSSFSKKTPYPAKAPAHSKSEGTIAQTQSKGERRIAHSSLVVRNQAMLDKYDNPPVVLIDTRLKSTKIPATLRQFVLDKVYTTCKSLHYEPKDAFERAIVEEEDLLRRGKTANTYKGMIACKVLTIQKETNGPDWEELGRTRGVCGETKELDHSDPNIRSQENNVVSHESILNGSAENISVQTIHRNEFLPEGNELHQHICRYVMTEHELIENGYPRPHETRAPGRATAVPRNPKDNFVYTSTRRTCIRCHRDFPIRHDGSQLEGYVCRYHSGKKAKRQVNKRVWEGFFTCCGGDLNEAPCINVEFHVPKNPLVSDMGGFVSALRDEGPSFDVGNNPWDIIAIDCEMVYTTAGTELARATVVGQNGVVLFDEIVKPPNKVLDYNTMYSGLTEQDLENATATLRDVQAVLLTHVRPNTIFIGHSLESDLIALRFVHDCIVDTAVLYPHPKGFPIKKALRTLTSEVLNQIIQNSEKGHDSSEDARAALDLVLHRVKQDRKSQIN